MAVNGCDDANGEQLWSSTVVFTHILESVDGLSSNIREKSGGGFVMRWL